ncbi:MAG TPA: NBR1-Ig-like domain-containing protein [Anaerolineae bacterium]
MNTAFRVLLACCCVALTVGCRVGGATADAVTVAINAPDNNATLPIGKPFQVAVSATAAAGVARVELTVNGILVAVSNNALVSSPYQAAIYYTPDSEGPLNLIVRAFDKNNTPSAPVGLTIQAVLAARLTVVPVSTTTVINGPPGDAATSPAATPTYAAGVTGPNGCVLNAQFIADITIPDDTNIPLRGAFTKTWRVRNTGTCVWDGTYHLVFASGDQLGAAGSVPLGVANSNDVIDVSVPMQAPETGSGELKAQWRLASPGNTIFGNPLTVVIRLPAPTATPVPTPPPPTATPVPTITFNADNLMLTRGGCTALRWTTNNVSAVFLNDISVASPALKDICPAETTTYTLRVNLNDGTSAASSVVISVSSGKLLYSFADSATGVRWYNDLTDTLSFGGPDTDSRGFAMSRDGQALEDGSLQLKVIETHPRWAPGGSLSGDFYVPSVIHNGDRFISRIGFLNNATSGSVTLRVLFNSIQIGETTKAYDGMLKDWTIDLSAYAGQSGKITLQATGVPTVTEAWICWINPRLER